MTNSARFLTSRGVLGVLLIAFGALALLSSASYRYDFWDYWPLLFVVWGAVRFANYGARNWFFSAALIAIGLLLALEIAQPRFWYRWGYYFDWDYIWPLALVLLGGYLIARNLRSRSLNGLKSETSSGDTINLLALLGGNTTKVNSKGFLGGSAMAVLGGVEVNMRDAALSADRETVEIDATAILGGIEMYVPTNWAVQIKGTPVLGSIEDQRPNPPDSSAAQRTLVVDGLAVMGSIEIKP